MKKTALALSFILFTVLSFAQTKLDKIIDKVVETMGGKEKLSSIKSIKMSGNGEQGGVKYPVNYYAVHNKALRNDYSFNGMMGYSIITKDSGFNFSPFGGMATPERMTDDDIKLASDSYDLEGHLVNYKAKGSTIELMENEDIDGVDAIQLRVNLKNKKTVFYYIDPDTYYVIRTTIKGESNGQEFKNSSNFYNFKKNKDGLLFAYTVDNVTYDTIETNISIDEKLFSTKK
jgi:hypothetical protein